LDTPLGQVPPKGGARSSDLDEAKKEARTIQLCLLDKGIRELGVVWELSEADIYSGRRTSGKMRYLPALPVATKCSGELTDIVFSPDEGAVGAR
jgi:hypothetical protein